MLTIVFAATVIAMIGLIVVALVIQYLDAKRDTHLFLRVASPILIITFMLVLCFASALILTGCDRPAPGPAPAAVASQLDQWAAPATTDQQRLDNLIRCGLVGRIDLNTGDVRVSRAMYDRLDATDQERLRQLLWREVRRNNPDAVMRVMLEGER